MSETKPRSIRVDDETWEAFCNRKGTQNEVLRELLCSEPAKAKPDDIAQKNYERLNRIEIMLEEILETVQSTPATTLMPVESSQGFDPCTVPGVQTGLSDQPKNAQCVHCPKRFTGPKFANLCPECAEKGHKGDVRNCPECWQPA